MDTGTKALCFSIIQCWFQYFLISVCHDTSLQPKATNEFKMNYSVGVFFHKQLIYWILSNQIRLVLHTSLGFIFLLINKMCKPSVVFKLQTVSNKQSRSQTYTFTHHIHTEKQKVLTTGELKPRNLRQFC